MNRRALKKKFDQEVILDIHGARNSRRRIVLRFVSLCFKVMGGAVLSLVLVPLSLFRPIEIWQMNTRISKISFFIEDLETGLRDLQSRNLTKGVWIIALYPIDFPNKQLARMYRCHMFIVGNKLKVVAEFARFIWPIFGVKVKRAMDRSEKKFERWNSGRPTLSFNSIETKNGLSLDKELGLSDGAPYVCFAISSKKYRQLVDYGQTKNTVKINDLISNVPEISNYLPVIRELTNNGIFVIRMGKHEEVKLPDDLGQKVKDYAFGNRSDFGDVWLPSRCAFVLVAGVGAWWFGAIFNKPVVMTDSYAIRGSLSPSDLFISQLPWLKKEECYASFEWMTKNYMWAQDGDRLGKEYLIVKNSSQQIIDVTNEMRLRISGEWVSDKQDIELQDRLKSVQSNLNVGERAHARMGAKFLREHQYLLPQ